MPHTMITVQAVPNYLHKNDSDLDPYYRGYSFDSIARRIWGQGAYVDHTYSDGSVEVYRDVRGESTFMGWLVPLFHDEETGAEHHSHHSHYDED